MKKQLYIFLCLVFFCLVCVGAFVVVGDAAKLPEMPTRINLVR